MVHFLFKYRHLVKPFMNAGLKMYAVVVISAAAVGLAGALCSCSDRSYPCPKAPAGMVLNPDGSTKLRKVSVPTDKHGLVRKKAYY